MRVRVRVKVLVKLRVKVMAKVMVKVSVVWPGESELEQWVGIVIRDTVGIGIRISTPLSGRYTRKDSPMQLCRLIVAV